MRGEDGKGVEGRGVDGGSVVRTGVGVGVGAPSVISPDSPFATSAASASFFPQPKSIRHVVVVVPIGASSPSGSTSCRPARSIPMSLACCEAAIR